MKSKYAVFLLLFVVGMWGGNELVKKYISTRNEKVNEEAKIRFNTSVTPFSLPDLDGVLHDFKEWDGKVRVLNFWATWCGPCRKETPMFVELQTQYAGKGLQFVGIAIDDPQKVRDFVDTYGVNYPTLVGGEKAIEVAKQYGDRFGALPYTVVINRQGKIVHAQGGELTRSKAQEVVLSLL